MKTIHLSPNLRRSRTTASQRQLLLAEFDRSGLSAAAFARRHQIAYSTFCKWRSKHSRSPHPTFAEVELLRPHAPTPVVIELGSHARIRIESREQTELAAALLKHFQTPC